MSARVSSMTGFARVSGEADWGSWAIEAKSVNGRSLDVRLNVPGGFEEVERAIKQAASKLFARGNIQIGLRIEVSGGAETLSVNHDALQQLLRQPYVLPPLLHAACVPQLLQVAFVLQPLQDIAASYIHPVVH